MSLRVLETRKRQHIVPVLLPDLSTILGYCFIGDLLAMSTATEPPDVLKHIDWNANTN